LSLYFIADPACCAGRDVLDVAQAVVRGGATIVQYRDKENSRDVVLHNAIRLREAVTEVPLIINDHVDIALESGTDGVHLGQGDVDPAEARARLGPDAIIGQTAFTPAHMAAIDPGAIDYAGTGPFYSTKTDKGKPVLGPEKFKKLLELSPVPVVGIGGITADNAQAVLKAGANGVAVMRGLSEAEDPQSETEKLKENILCYDRYR